MEYVERGLKMGVLPLPDILGYEDLSAQGLTRHGLDRLIESGEFERVAPGVFLRHGLADDTTAAWIAIATRRPEATLCLLTALSLHDLTDEIPARSDVAIPRGAQPVTVYHAPIAWHRFDVDTFSIGRGQYALPGGMSIGLYSAERTLIDLFRLRHTWGSDLALDALKQWLRGSGNSPGSLLTMAESFPKARPAIHHALEVLL
ncbi:type IV toxin-antitoxin system AbiEi family antitoxin domain-containing protein [Schaalia sp. JY-X159]|uniref:type IV toxin-antitoxin system AbiEi family antitoxin domain-containing protein n=1 Tax=Schaalia sp. JY-X159 TaxID=2758575 RepID=UPI001CB73827|nr:type IV toxin-antitoxin system AbiEi family antitoxin domain-containing protein [Schaalia sp. JY-X159]